MSVLKMERKASDNEYFHCDFYVTADNGLQYLGETYGTEEVIDFLTFYAKNISKSLVLNIRKQGLKALKEYFIEQYKEVKASEVLTTRLDGKVLTIEISSCPAVIYMKSINHEPSKWYIETVNTVYKTIADISGLLFEMVFYNETNGATKLIFKEK